LTKHDTKPSSGPAPQGDGAPEITEAMLAAGERELVEEIGICGADIARGIAEAVYRAMWPKPDSLWLNCHVSSPRGGGAWQDQNVPEKNW